MAIRRSSGVALAVPVRSAEMSGRDRAPHAASARVTGATP
jgi:hypothetical protein